ncbi:MgtC/SapB family protein [Bradyrhizobium sp. AUGA SZCCT0177]|uniref:MgtC/SapB family protein n=1 Tax=Bradyrhizobium sp. AUGA SZCCT0177 TaxID=2807665 RepID=UPI001BADC5F7|nr:DUF4010 domain-containing protein [Bradyrhizobium sp. AUGA SZCCT0177]MBR1282919.1 MgtC/SapB family protein [Bradyrhizobium sp. AUGA SZCCT0177]
MEGDLTNTLLFRFLTALAIGLLIGIERGWRERDAPSGSRTAGVRTYTLSGLIGAVAAEITRVLASPWPLSLSMLTFVAVFAWFKMREIEHDREFSVTGVLAAFVVFSLGALSVLGDPTSAAAGGVATAGVLAAREQLHGWLARLTWKELRSALLLLAMTVVVLPMLPDRTVDPWSSINPREIWLFMIMTAAVSYGGYIAVRLAGPSLGVLVGGLVGSVVSSTAVTITFARRAKEGGSAYLFAGGALIGGMVSIVRVLTIVSLVAPQLIAVIAVPALTAAAVFGTGGLVLLYTKGEQADGGLDIGNPFDLTPLVLFVSAYSAIALLNGWFSRSFGASALLLTSSISGLFDVDVAVLSAARLATTPVAADVAARAILLALAMNAVSRAAIAVAAGSARFSIIYGTVTAAAALAGGTSWFFGCCI